MRYVAMSSLGLLVLACNHGGAASEAPTVDAAVVSFEVAPVAAVAGIEMPLTAVVDPKDDAAGPILLTHARVIDGSGGPARADQDVLLVDGSITEVGSGVVAPKDARVIDLGGRTLLPGFIDAHVHLTFSPSQDYAHGVVEGIKQSEADAALLGVRNARDTLRAGFTTVRVVGGGFSDRSLRDAIVGGFVPGPRMLVANHAIGITGGHCDGTNEMHPEAFASRGGIEHGVADGPEDVRRAVRFQIKHGADVIKVCATGGVMSQGDAVGVTQMSREELRTAVEVATAAERKVAAHAHGNEGIANAVWAGVHSIEHGSVLSREVVAMMKKKGTFLVPTLYVGQAVERQAAAGRLSEESAAKIAIIVPKMRESFAMAVKAGVKIALGSDAGVFDHGENGGEFVAMVQYGMKPQDAIVAGTSAAAELLGLDNVGRIAPGMLADLVVVDGDPLTEISVVESPVMVIKGGVVHVAPRWDP